MQIMSANKCPSSNSGFSLIEMAIVLVIIGLLVGAMVMPLSTQVEYQR